MECDESQTTDGVQMVKSFVHTHSLPDAVDDEPHSPSPLLPPADRTRSGSGSSSSNCQDTSMSGATLVDSLLMKLLSLRGGSPGDMINLTEEDIRRLIAAGRRVLLSQETLIEVSAPVNVCGDVHGYVSCTMHSSRSLNVCYRSLEME